MTTTKEAVKEGRRYSETISVVHKEKPRDVAVQFRISPSVENEFYKRIAMERSELVVRRESIPVGMKMDVCVDATPEIVTEERTLVVRQEDKLQEVQPLVHKRRFSETLAIEHRSKPHEMVLEIEVPTPKKSEISKVLYMQKSAPRPVKLEVEVEEQEAPRPHQYSALQVFQTSRVEAIETQRQTLNFPVVEHGSPPLFLWQLQSQKVMDGDEVRFTCKVQAKPMPTITWFHNGKVVHDNPDFRTSYNQDNGEVVLFIVEVFPQDTGVYECSASNKFGSATTRAQLIVEGLFRLLTSLLTSRFLRLIPPFHPFSTPHSPPFPTPHSPPFQPPIHPLFNPPFTPFSTTHSPPFQPPIHPLSNPPFTPFSTPHSPPFQPPIHPLFNPPFTPFPTPHSPPFQPPIHPPFNPPFTPFSTTHSPPFQPPIHPLSNPPFTPFSTTHSPPFQPPIHFHSFTPHLFLHSFSFHLSTPITSFFHSPSIFHPFFHTPPPSPPLLSLLLPPLPFFHSSSPSSCH